MAEKNTNDQKNDANDEPAARTVFRRCLHSLLVDNFVFGLLAVLSFVLSFVAYSRTESWYSFGFFALPILILVFRLAIALVGAIALRKGEEEEDSWSLRFAIASAILMIALLIGAIADSYKMAWGFPMALIALVFLSICIPLAMGGKDRWPGYFFVGRILFFALVAVVVFAFACSPITDGADSDDKATYQAAGIFASIYILLYLLTILLMRYIARQDNAEAARVGARFVIYPLLFDLIILLMLIPSTNSLVGKIMDAYFSLSTVSYAVKLWDTYRDEIEKEKKSSVSCD